MSPVAWNVRLCFWDVLNEASFDVLDIFSDFIDRVADEEVEVRLPYWNGSSVSATPIEDRKSYVEYAHYIRKLLLPTSDTVFVRFCV